MYGGCRPRLNHATAALPGTPPSRPGRIRQSGTVFAPPRPPRLAPSRQQLSLPPLDSLGEINRYCCTENTNVEREEVRRQVGWRSSVRMKLLSLRQDKGWKDSSHLPFRTRACRSRRRRANVPQPLLERPPSRSAYNAYCMQAYRRTLLLTGQERCAVLMACLLLPKFKVRSDVKKRTGKLEHSR